MTYEEKRILKAIGNVDEKYIEVAVPSSSAGRSRAWIKWGALAACLCLVAAGGVFFKTVYTDSDSQETLFERLEAYGLPVVSVETPTFISAGKDQPMATKEDLVKIVQAGTTVRGQVQSGFYVEVTQGNEHWYIAQIRLKVTDVITGTLEDTSVEIVSACAYAGEGLEPPEGFLIEDALLPCQEGFEGVFVLRDIDEDALWNIAGTEVNPSSLGGYLVNMRLDKVDGGYTYGGIFLADSDLSP